MILLREGKLSNSVKGLERGKVFLLEDEIWLQADDRSESLFLECPSYRLSKLKHLGTYHLTFEGAPFTVQVERYISRWSKVSGEYRKFRL